LPDVADSSIKVPYGGTAVVTIGRRKKKRPVEDALASEFRGGWSEGRVGLTGRCRATFRDLDVVHFPLAVPTGDANHVAPANTFRARSMETNLNATISERTALDAMLLGARGETRTSTGRVIPKAWPLPVGIETDGALTKLTLTNVKTDAVASMDLLGETNIWQKEIPLADRIAETEELLASATDAQASARIREALDALRARRDEVWSVRLGRYGKEGTGSVRVGAGQFLPAVESVYHYESFGGATPTRWTRPRAVDSHSTNPSIVPPLVSVGWDSSAHLEVDLVPRRHVIYMGWWTSYYMVTLWAQLVIWMPNQRRFRDRLPWDPPFSFAAGIDNGAVMSEYLPQTRAYAEMLAQDLLPVRALLGFILELIQRASGRWIVFESSQFPGELCGVVRIRYPSGVVEELVAWRAGLRVVPGNVQISGGQLVTQEVSPDLGIYSFIFPGNRPPPPGVLVDPLPHAA
jgi:hypothetical protein